MTPAHRIELGDTRRAAETHRLGTCRRNTQKAGYPPFGNEARRG